MATQPIFDDVPAWPTAQPAAATIGHNKPPVEEEARAAFRDRLIAERPDFEQRVEELEGAALRVRVTNDEEYGRAGDYLKMLRAATAHVTDAHKAAKEPYLSAGRVIDGLKNDLIARLDSCKEQVQPAMNQYAAEKEARERAERERVLAEQRAAAEAAARAERERQEAEAAAARAAAEATSAEEQAEAAALAEEARRRADELAENAVAAAEVKRAEPVRSDGGTTVSTKTVWNSEVEDYAKAFKAVKTDPKVKKEIEAAIARLVRAGQREIPGVRIWPTKQAVAR